MIILRKRNKEYTSGAVYHNGKRIAYSLELPWFENQKNISCIPDGKYKYKVAKYTPQNPEKLPYKAIKILNVPNRTGIWCHVGNWLKDTTGCILFGVEKTKNKAEVTRSKEALDLILSLIPDKGYIRFATILQTPKEFLSDARVNIVKLLEDQKKIHTKELKKISLPEYKLTFSEKLQHKFRNFPKILGGGMVTAGTSLVVAGEYVIGIPIAIIGGMIGGARLALEKQTKYGEKGEFAKKDWKQLIIDFLTFIINKLKGK